MSQNRSSAVMAQRAEPHDSLDFFPTPPWAGRALVEHVLIGGGWRRDQLAKQSCWEPACGSGELVVGLSEYFNCVWASDVFDYGRGFAVHDFLFPVRPQFLPKSGRVHWAITNPPFRLAAQFIKHALSIAIEGVAMLVRTSFIEGIERYRTLFNVHRPALLAPFSERVPMVKGRCDPKAGSATSYCWIVWSKLLHHAGRTNVRWIPPCRKLLERPGDYDVPTGEAAE